MRFTIWLTGKELMALWIFCIVLGREHSGCFPILWRKDICSIHIQAAQVYCWYNWLASTSFLLSRVCWPRAAARVPRSVSVSQERVAILHPVHCWTVQLHSAPGPPHSPVSRVHGGESEQCLMTNVTPHCHVAGHCQDHPDVGLSSSPLSTGEGRLCPANLSATDVVQDVRDGS